jgi:DNA-binding transcriptional ArsR family regulator
VPLDLRLDPADALGLRFARSPVWETLHALRTAREPRRQGHHLSWLRSVDVEAIRGAAGVLAPVVPAVGWQPDFLSPIPAGPTTTIDDDLAALAATPLPLVESDLRRCLTDPRRDVRDVDASVRALLADPAAALGRFVAAVATCWEHLVRPFWPAVDDLLAADIAHRADLVATSGLATVLDGLHPMVQWRGDALAVLGRSHGRSTDARGRGLVLMPSVFTWPDVVAMTDPPWQPTLVYPARGVGTLWPPGPRRRTGALRDLLGASRAALLHALDAEASTTALARRVGLGLPTTSVHLRVLRDAGLVTARRSGREVRYRRSALGSALVGGNG